MKPTPETSSDREATRNVGSTRDEDDDDQPMYVIKRDGSKQEIHFDKITERISKLCDMKPPLDRRYVDPVKIAQKVIIGIYPGVKTTELDTLAAETAAYQSVRHFDLDSLAARIVISSLQKETLGDIVKVAEKLHAYVNPKTGKRGKLISDDALAFIQRNGDALKETMDYERDFQQSYFGFMTLKKSYLIKCNGKPVERLQDLFMRTSVGMHMPDNAGAASDEENLRALVACIETYEYLSKGFFIHATPTLFNSGTCTPQMSSCFLVDMKEDSIDGIYDTLKQCAMISKSAGGIGVSISKIRASQSYISGTGGDSNGIVPMLRVFNDTARYVDQGGGKRKGAFAVYLEPWHADVFAFLDLKKNHGKEERRARDLFYALWIPDLFMRRVKDDKEWSLFCPNEAPGLPDVHSEEFDALYERYEREGRARSTISARKLWNAIIDSQIETGTPYMLYKDACNSKSNQQHLGTIKSSNLCTEIIEYTDADEVAVCNLASLALPKYVDVEKGVFDHDLLAKVVSIAVRNLNKVIDRNFYPVPEARKSNMRHRPIGLGVQGLADAFLLLGMPFTSDAARKLNREIFETIYFAAMSTSCKIAEELGETYESYPGSPLSEGKLQFDLWDQLPESERQGCVKRHDWSALRERLAKHGARNSLLVAPMPTASTSQLLGNNEAIEPYTSNCYTRGVSAGEFTVINKHLVRELMKRGMWNEQMRDDIRRYRGSIQEIDVIPPEVKELYKTVWEVKQRALVDMAADRGIYVDQSQSFNVHIPSPSHQVMSSLHFHTWQSGLKTGSYYLRTKAATEADQVTVSQKARKVADRAAATQAEADEDEPLVCRMEEGCLTCGS